MMTKIAILADSHLIYAYHKKYDKIAEFKRFIDLLLNNSKPDIIMVLGDFFDKKFTNQGRPISHIEGSKSQIPIVEIIKSSKIPWYALLGNHEDESVLKSLAQSASNFHYMSTDLEDLVKNKENDKQLLETDNALFWFGNVQIDQSYKKKEELLKKFAQVAARYDSNNKDNILLLHIDLIRRSATIGLEDNIVKTLSNSFKWVITGHEHTYLKKYKKFQNIICVPPSLPTWVSMGRGSILNYKFSEGNLIQKGKYKDIHGFLMLNDEDFKLEYIPFRPTMPTIEVNYDVTGKDLSVIEEDWKNISEAISHELIGKFDIQSIIIIPIFTGKMKHLYTFDVNQVLGALSDEIEEINIVEIREKLLEGSSLSIDELGENEIMNTELVFSRTLKQISIIKVRLEERNIDIEDEKISGLINKIKDLDQNFFYIKTQNKNIRKYVSEIIELLLPNFNEILQKSWTASQITNIIEESFRKR